MKKNTDKKLDDNELKSLVEKINKSDSAIFASDINKENVLNPEEIDEVLLAIKDGKIDAKHFKNKIEEQNEKIIKDKNDIVCPACDSMSVILLDKKEMSTGDTFVKYKCKNCEKEFSIIFEEGLYPG